MLIGPFSLPGLVEVAMQVLIAEDNFTSRRGLEIHLGQWGYEVISTKDGTEAWKVFQSEKAQARHSRLDDAWAGRPASVPAGAGLSDG